MGDKLEYAIKFDFLASNNDGLQICIALGAKSVWVGSDSQLIVIQVSGEFESEEDNMTMCRSKTKEMLNKSLQEFQISHVPRSGNQQADTIALMAS